MEEEIGDGNLEGAIYSVYGRAFANSLTRVMAKDAGSIEEFQAQIAIIPYIVAMLCPRD